MNLPGMPVLNLSQATASRVDAFTAAIVRLAAALEANTEAIAEANNRERLRTGIE